VLLLLNKADLAGGSGGAAVPGELPPGVRGIIPGLSAKTGAGLGELCRAAAGILDPEAAAKKPGEPPGPQSGADRTSPLISRRFDAPARGSSSQGIGTARQKELIDAAAAAVEEALALACQGRPLDIITPLLREGVNALGEITGEVSTADILELMFSRFCVGK
jgi:tRNA modification GTPase